MAFDLFAGEGQEGTQDCHVAALLAMTCGALLAMTCGALIAMTWQIWKRRDSLHAGEALEAGSADHVKDQCLCIVVRMVRNDNCLIAMLLA